MYAVLWNADNINIHVVLEVNVSELLYMRVSDLN